MHIDTIFDLVHQFVTIFYRFCQTIIIFNISTFIKSDSPVSTTSTNLRKNVRGEGDRPNLRPSYLVTDMFKFSTYIFYLFGDIVLIPKSITIKGSPDQSHFIFEINVGKRRIRHRTTLNLNDLIFNRFWVDLEIQFQSRSIIVYDS